MSPDEINLKSTTTLEENLHTLAQRRINLIWECTQALIALSVVGATLTAVFRLPTQNELLSNALFVVIGFYFGRTNHARVETKRFPPRVK